MKRIRSRIPAFCAFAAACIIAALYLDGWFDISFIVRGSRVTAEETAAPPIPDTDAPDTDAPVTNAPDTDAPDTDAPDTGVVDVVFPPLDTIEGASPTLEEWNDSMTLCEIDASYLPDSFSTRSHTVYDVSCDAPHDGTMYSPVYTARVEDAPAVALYMGYVIVETDADHIYNIYRDGEPIGSFDDTEIAPAYCRDSAGNPLFAACGEDGGSPSAYYILDTGKHRFRLADYDPAADGRGVRFDYGPDYGVPSDSRTFLCEYVTENVLSPLDKVDETGAPLYTVTPVTRPAFALADSKHNPLGEFSYFAAYNFSESRAAVVGVDVSGIAGRDAGGVESTLHPLSFISKSGRVSIKAARTRRDPELARTVIDFYMPAMTDGKESIGFYYFEHGLVRVRVLTIDYYRYERDGTVYVISDDDALITSSGERFYIPSGYDVLAYSSGMILLSGNSGYGYMNWHGEFVVDPDFDYAAPFYEGLAVVGRGGEVGLIDADGEFVIPLGRYSYISDVSCGVIAAYDADGWHLLYKTAAAAE